MCNLIKSLQQQQLLPIMCFVVLNKTANVIFYFFALKDQLSYLHEMFHFIVYADWDNFIWNYHIKVFRNLNENQTDMNKLKLWFESAQEIK